MGVDDFVFFLDVESFLLVIQMMLRKLLMILLLIESVHAFRIRVLDEPISAARRPSTPMSRVDGIISL